MTQSKPEWKMKWNMTVVLGAAAVLLVWGSLVARPASAEQKPPVPFTVGAGYDKYQEMCAQCHGEWADGTDQGPPLIHTYYVPSHHSDESFYRAILQGAKAHHWRFGDMAPMEGATMNDAVNITRFVRWLQQYRKLY